MIVKTGFDQSLDDIFGDTTDERGVAEEGLAIDVAVQFAALRQRRCLTQQQLAEKLGKTQQAISKIENPWQSRHSLERLKEAVEAMDATIDVTIVPLEDLASYRALLPPKPALEALPSRSPSRRQPGCIGASGPERLRFQAANRPAPWPTRGRRPGSNPSSPDQAGEERGRVTSLRDHLARRSSQDLFYG